MTKNTRTKCSTRKERSSGPGRGKNVWRIYRFRERFEPPENVRKCRKSGLDFTRDYVGLSAGNEAVGYWQSLSMLSNGDGLEYSLLFGIYRQLINQAGQRSRAYRGYLLDPANEPLSDSDIGRLLNIHAKTITRLLRKLERAKLLERVPMPSEWDLTQDELPSKESQTQENAGALDNGKGDNQAQKRAVSAEGRQAAENSADGRKPLKERQTARQPNGCNKINKQKARIGKTTASARKKENGLSANNNVNAQKGKSNKQAPGPPTTQPLSSEPQESDEGGRARNVTCPPESAEISRHGLAYGLRVYLALKLPWDLDSLEARREISSFGSKHDELCRKLGKLSPPVVDGLLSRALREAEKMSRRSANKNRGAVWNHAVSNIIAKHAAQQQRSPP